ncbi:MAG TPA: peptidylprolyl isomerase [Clostridia bacterium]|nr:peptidylprolyl isomerase [Clostridia bacterium]
MGNDEIKSVDNEEIESKDNEEIKSVDNEEIESIDNDEIETIDNEEIVTEKNLKVKKKKKPVNKRKTIITIAIIAGILILIGTVVAIGYIADSKSYVATVGVERISKLDYEYYLKLDKSSAEQQSQVEATVDAKKTFWETKDPTSGTSQAEALKTSTLDFLYQVQILSGEALKKDPNALKTQEPITKKTIVDGYIANKQTESVFIKAIKDNFDISYDAYIKIRTKYDVALAQLTQAQKSIAITDEAVQNYYNGHKDAIDLITIKYSMYSTVDATTSQPLPAEKIQIAKTKAETALDKLKKGADFDKLIADESEDPNKATNKGEAPFSVDPSSQQYFQVISDPLKAMAVNEYKLIDNESQGFYIVIKYVSKTTYDEQKETVKSNMQQQEYQKTFDTLRSAKPLIKNQNGKIIDNIDILQYK